MERRNGLSSYLADEGAGQSLDDGIQPDLQAEAGVAHTGASKKDISAAEKKNILRERALKLAKKRDTGRQDGETLEVIEFTLAHEHYAVEMSYIREVYALKDLTPVPCTPSHILGIINLRGQVISVTDVREYFDLPKREISDQFRVLVVKNFEHGTRDTGRIGCGRAQSPIGGYSVATSGVSVRQGRLHQRRNQRAPDNYGYGEVPFGREHCCLSGSWRMSNSPAGTRP